MTFTSSFTVYKGSTLHKQQARYNYNLPLAEIKDEMYDVTQLNLLWTRGRERNRMVYKYNIITCKSNTDTKNTDYEHLFKILIVGDSGVGKIMYASPIRWSTIQWIIYYHHCCRFHHQNSFLCPKIITSPESATIQEVYIAQVLIVSTNPNNSNTQERFSGCKAYMDWSYQIPR